MDKIRKATLAEIEKAVADLGEDIHEEAKET